MVSNTGDNLWRGCDVLGKSTQAQQYNALPKQDVKLKRTN
jgi:hypothetical protein